MQQTSEKAKTRPAVRAVLIVSLGLNLLVGGAIVGGILKGRPPAAFSGFDMTLGPVSQALDHKDRDAMRQDLRDRLGPMQRDSEGRRAAFDALMAALTADPFDPEVLRVMFAEQRAKADAAMTAGQEALLDRLVAMSAEDRADYAERLAKELTRGGRKD